jgi:hypothetical protein
MCTRKKIKPGKRGVIWRKIVLPGFVDRELRRLNKLKDRRVER